VVTGPPKMKRSKSSWLPLGDQSASTSAVSGPGGESFAALPSAFAV
jgi:hypothetical protein